MAVMDRVVFALLVPKQMKNDDMWGAWSAQVQMQLLLVHEFLNSPLMHHMWTVACGAPLILISKNSCRWWWVEVAARRISQIDQELREFWSIEVLWGFWEFGEFGEFVCDFGELWNSVRVCYD